MTIELEDTPGRQALDDVCAQAGCVWSLDESGARGVLQVRFTDR